MGIHPQNNKITAETGTEMIADTAGVDCMIITQSELGIYDTVCVPVTLSLYRYIRLKNGEYFRLQENQQLIEGKR